MNENLNYLNILIRRRGQGRPDCTPNWKLYVALTLRILLFLCLTEGCSRYPLKPEDTFLHSYGLVAIFPPREDVKVGDVFPAAKDRNAARERNPAKTQRILGLQPPGSSLRGGSAALPEYISSGENEASINAVLPWNFIRASLDLSGAKLEEWRLSYPDVTEQSCDASNIFTLFGQFDATNRVWRVKDEHVAILSAMREGSNHEITLFAVTEVYSAKGAHIVAEMRGTISGSANTMPVIITNNVGASVTAYGKRRLEVGATNGWARPLVVGVGAWTLSVNSTNWTFKADPYLRTEAARNGGGGIRFIIEPEDYENLRKR